MEKGLLFFTISVCCLWLILDDFFGTRRLSTIVNNLTPDFNLKSMVQDGTAAVLGADEDLNDELNKKIEQQKVNDAANASKSKAEQDVQKMMENALKWGKR